MSKTKLLFVNDEMTMGGVARILNNLLVRLDPQTYDIDLLVLHPHGELMKEIPSHIHLLPSRPFFKGVDVSLKQALLSFNVNAIFSKLRILFYMKTGLIHSKLRSERKKLHLKTYDVEFSAKEGFCTLFVSVGDAHRRLNWVQVDYGQMNYSKNHMPLMIKTLQNIDMNIACSKEVEASYRTLFKTQKIHVIHNFIDDLNIKKLASEECDYSNDPSSIHFITVARFHPQKSVDRLINAFSQVHQKHPNTKLILIGDGHLRTSLETQVKELHLESSVAFLGMRQNPYPYIKAADVFVMSSLYEGYPTITIESFISGTPVLTTKVSGVEEQIIQDKNGWIVENSIEGLVKQMNQLMEHPHLIQKAKDALVNYQYPNDILLSALEHELSYSNVSR